MKYSDDGMGVETACRMEMEICKENGQLGDKMRPCLQKMAHEKKNPKCMNFLRKPDDKDGGKCPAGCVDMFVKKGLCDKWDDAGEMMSKDSDFEKCMVEDCQKMAAEKCFGKCDQKCLGGWVKNGGCKVFAESNESDESVDPTPFLPKECDASNLISCEWMAKHACMKMEMPKGCKQPMEDCMRRMKIPMDEDVDMTEEQEKMFGQCSWKAAVAMNNDMTDECIRSMMK